MTRFHRSLPIYILLILALISACAGPVAPSESRSDAPVGSDAVAEASEPTEEPTDQPTEEPTDQPTAEPTDRPTRTPRPEPTVVLTPTTAAYTDTLPVEYTQDSDGNVIPDFMEIEFGDDPLVADCSRECGDGALGSELNLETNVLLLFDSSGSMAGEVGGERKIDVAKQAVERYLRIGSQGANVGLLVYGHTGNNTDAGKVESCVGVELLAPIGQADDANAADLVGRFEPTGWTPIGGALEAAEAAFAGREGQGNRIIIVSDGEETCGGDPVAVAQRLHEQGFNVQTDVIGFDLENQAVVEQMQAIAAAGGGTYFDARTQDQFRQYLDGQLQALYETREAFACNVGLSGPVMVCDQNQMLRALRWLWRKADEVKPTDPAQAQALRDLAEAIREESNRRFAIYREAGQRSQELFDQVQRMKEQLEQSTP